MNKANHKRERSETKNNMSQAPYITDFSQHLFWDVSPADFNADRCPAQVIQRVLERGEWSDWCLVRDYYGLTQIAEVCKKLRTLSPEALSYICCMTDTKKEDYRCYHYAQSNPTLWNSY